MLWWGQNESAFPLLSQKAKKYIGTVATSVPAERLFQKQQLAKGKITSDQRMFDKLLFLNTNLKLQ